MARPWRLEWPRKLNRARLLHGVSAATGLAATRPSERPAPLIHLLHIMKTGGTSLTNALVIAAGPAAIGAVRTGVFLDDLVRADPESWDSLGLVAGHLPFEARDVLPEGTVSVTMLRDPVERTLSHFAEVCRNPDVVAEHPDLTLDEFVESPRWRTLVEDYQTRQLAHRVGLTGAGTEFDPAERYQLLGPPFPPEHELPLQCLFDCSPLEADRDALLTAALANLASVEIVGTIDDLDVVLRQALSLWPRAPRMMVGREQVSELRLARNDLPIRLIRRIEAATASDRELYDEARRRATLARQAERLSTVA